MLTKQIREYMARNGAKGGATLTPLRLATLRRTAAWARDCLARKRAKSGRKAGGKKKGVDGGLKAA